MLADDVAHLLEDFGSDLTLTRTVSATYNPATGTLSAGTSQTFVIRGVFINYMQDRVDGTVIRAGDRMLLVQAKDAPTTPAIGDRVDGVQVVDVRRIAPNGIAIAYTCQTRT